MASKTTDPTSDFETANRFPKTILSTKLVVACTVKPNDRLFGTLQRCQKTLIPANSVRFAPETQNESGNLPANVSCIRSFEQPKY
jgi:hypothetical protein